jgi:2-methylcitrate dehydratase PrpD
MGQLTESIIDFVTGTALDTPPQSALTLAQRGFIDTLGVMIAGRHSEVTQVTLNYANSVGGTTGEARVMLGSETSSVSNAALIGTTAAHALDYDDYAYSNHVSALMVPAIIADADRINASGQDMLAAYLAGFEVWGTAFKREPQHLHSKGWHPTGVFGPLGVAAALCRLRRLRADEVRNALGLACASGGGVMDNFGSHAKPWQGGRAAEAGVVAVALAGYGMTAGNNALDGDGGLMAALSPLGNVDRTTPAAMQSGHWLSAGPALNLKRHPTVGASQRSIDAALQLQQDHRPIPEQIARIVIRVSEKHAAVMRLHRPTTASEARFSAEFGVAAALVAGRVGLTELDDTFVQRADIQGLMGICVIETGPDDDPSYPVGAKFDTVSLELKDGTVLTSDPVYRFRGHGDNPMSETELREKFTICASHAISPQQIDELWDCLQALATLPSVRKLPTLRYL